MRATSSAFSSIACGNTALLKPQRVGSESVDSVSHHLGNDAVAHRLCGVNQQRVADELPRAHFHAQHIYRHRPVVGIEHEAAHGVARRFQPCANYRGKRVGHHTVGVVTLHTACRSSSATRSQSSYGKHKKEYFSHYSKKRFR